MSCKIQFFLKGKEISSENLHKLVKNQESDPNEKDQESNPDEKDQYKRYIATKENVKEILEKHGVAIIPKVLSQEEIENMKLGMWDYLEHVTSKFDVPIDRNNEKTWKSFYDLIPLHGMLVQHWQIGHAQYLWDYNCYGEIMKNLEKPI